MSPAQKPMPMVEYNQPVDMRFDQPAVLVYHTGEVISSRYVVQPAYSSNLAANVLAAVISNEIQKKYSDRYIYQYGQEQQKVFMTSLRDVLLKNHVFKTVEFVDDEKKIRPHQVMIIVDFTRTRVGSQERGLPILLKGNIIIKCEDQVFQKPFFIHNANEDARRSWSFQARTVDVSQQLMEKVCKTIKLWGQQRFVS
jgi:hypothetical protein